MSHHKLSLWSTILININVMFGTGIFINSVVLAQRAGFLGFLGYPLVGVLGFPLILTFMHLVALFPEGGFYTYGTETIGRPFGFLAAWAYTIGKLASGGLMTHVFVTLIQSIFPATQAVPALALDILTIALMTWANVHHIKTGKNITYTFVACKLIPAIFVILTGLMTYMQWRIPQEALRFEGIPFIIPLVLYACSGFEICCSLSRSIENPKVNMPKAILFSYVFALTISTAYQLMFFLSAGPALMEATTFLQAFPLLVDNCYQALGTWAGSIVVFAHLAAAASALGGSYGILFSVHWNLYELARNGHLPYSNRLIQFNKNNIPTTTLFIAAFVYLFFLCVTGPEQVVLQQIAALGSSFTYLLCVIAYFYSPEHSTLVGSLALCSCLLFVSACLQSLMTKGTGSLLIFLLLVILGIFFYMTIDNKKRTEPSL